MKVKAYTLMEVMVALAISSVVIIISMQGYFFFQKQYLKFKQDSEKAIEYFSFYNQLFKDCGSCLAIESYNDGVCFLFENDSSWLVSSMDQQIIYSHNLIQDTLIFPATETISLLKFEKDNLPLKGFILHFQVGDISQDLAFIKPYSSEEILWWKNLKETNQ